MTQDFFAGYSLQVFPIYLILQCTKSLNMNISKIVNTISSSLNLFFFNSQVLENERW